MYVGVYVCVYTYVQMSVRVCVEPAVWALCKYMYM